MEGRTSHTDALGEAVFDPARDMISIEHGQASNGQSLNPAKLVLG